MKRIFDLLFSALGLIVLLPILIILLLAIFLSDFRKPLYIAKRIGKNGKTFKMIKIRTMIINADKSGVDSTSSSDTRITKIGHIIRKYKIDELSQLINVFLGNMSLVGPRPNVKNETDLYTEEERKLLTVKPGITDISSIVFSDEGEILKGSSDPDLSYNQLIRPWKSRLGIIYIKNTSLTLDIKLIYYTLISIISKKKALYKINKLLTELNIDKKIIDIVKRDKELLPFPPPGSNKIVNKR